MRDLKRADRTETPPATGALDQVRTPAPAPAPRWRGVVARLDVFWPVLAVVLVVSVIFVASVAHTSMDGVGMRSSAPRASFTPRASAPAATAAVVIVQISSHPTRLEAQAAAAVLVQHGIPARVLDSDDFRPLNRGFFVVYAGPFPATSTGRADARRLQAQVPGALLRDVHAR